MKSIVMALVLMLMGVSSGQAGWHFGETKDLDVDIEYFDYAYKTASGEPVYYLGSNMRYRVTIKNLGNRMFNHYEARSGLYWSSDASCQRWWLDNQNVSFSAGSLFPGNASSGLRPIHIAKMGSASFEVLYPIPLELCPGTGHIQIMGRHKNNSGKDEVASFVIPIGLKLEKK